MMNESEKLKHCDGCRNEGNMSDKQTDLLLAMAIKCEQRADEWSGCAVYRDREVCEAIETMLRDLSKDIKEICASEAITTKDK